MGGQPQRTIVDVHLLLIRDGQILLTRRRGGYAAGGLHAPSGKADTGESVETAVIREGFEEVGVIVDPADLRCVHTLHVQNPGEEPRIGWFFEATRWAGEPFNREPDKCSEVGWFPLDDLPDGMIPYPAAGIAAYLAGVPFSILGWGEHTPRPVSPPVQPRNPALTASSRD
jgi:ADP-ribose pyrophosphatase YjhB (NUDIX family)